MPDASYIFSSTENDSERSRLQLLEKIHDPNTLSLLKPVGNLLGKRCLEVGAGAGSITKALCKKVGPKGEVWAVDRDIRFIKDFAEENLRVIAGDIRDIPLPENYFDLIHTRYVICHIPNPASVFEKLYGLLSKNGYLAIEEHDHTIAHPQDTNNSDGQAILRVMESVVCNFNNLEMDPALAFHLPQLLKKYPWKEFSWKVESRQVRGGSDIANFIGRSIDQIRDQLVNTGKTSQSDIDTYVRCSQDKNKAAVFYATGRVLAQK